MKHLKWAGRILFASALVCPASCSQLAKPGAGANTEDTRREAHFSILQVNDTYKVEGLENGSIGGFARLRTLRRQLQEGGEPVLMLHGGDFLFASIMSKYLKADSMIKVLNLMDGDEAAFDDDMVVVFGNHEFDDPDPGVLLGRIAQSDFAWLSSNARYRSSGQASGVPFSKRLGNVHDVLIKEIGGIKAGLFGITMDIQQPSYVDFDYGLDARRAAIRKAIAELKEKGAAVIIALTHQEFDQDQWLAREFPEVDLIVGGHEHFYLEKRIGNTWITKADADNQSAVVHDIRLLPDGTVETSHRKIDLDGRIAKDPLVDAEVGRQLARLAQAFKKQGKDMKRIAGYTRNLLEGVEPAVRSRETALGNFLADAMREKMHTDVAFLNAGAIRINDNIPPGPITAYDMEGLLYFDNELVSFELTGAQLLGVLKNAVSKSHLGDGRFLQVSGLRFKYRARQANGVYAYAIDPADVWIKPQGASVYTPLDPYKKYRAATLDFVWEKGFSDGYEIFAEGKGKTSPPRLDGGAHVSFRTAVEDAIGRLPDKTVTNRIEGRIVRLEQ
jgi:2',3'-cyclic-nucleotide 2'-phosphodiesterase (5'-nucleotidase family)